MTQTTDIPSTHGEAIGVSPQQSAQPEKAESGRDLAAFLRNELTACITFANHATAMRMTGNQELAEQAIANAERSYATLLPFLSDATRSQGLNAEELAEFRTQLDAIRNTLDDLEKVGRIALLAYQFWQQRGCPHGSSEEDWFRAEREIAG